VKEILATLEEVRDNLGDQVKVSAGSIFEFSNSSPECKFARDL